jgi:hypothetical protein
MDGEPERENEDGNDDDIEEDHEEIDATNEEINGGGPAPDFNYEWTECTINDPPERGTRTGNKILLESNVPYFKKQSAVGPNKSEIRRLAAVTELDFFKIFWTNNMMEKMCKNTNWFGSRYIVGWKELKIPEFKAFLAIIMELGKTRFPSRDLAFDQGIHGSGFVKTIGMNLARFNAIVKAWRFEDYSNLSPEEIAAKKANDPFWPVKKLAEEMALQFGNMYQCGQAMDIDEQTVPFKGRHKCRCYNPKKIYKWHFKLYALNDSKSGYMSNFFLYQGKAEVRPPNISATMWPIMKLLETGQHSNLGHIICTDNWYTSIAVLLFLASIGCAFIGTVKVNKSGLPPAGIFPKTGRGRKRRGEMKSMTANVSAAATRPVNAYFTAWQDNKPVHMLSSLPTFKTQVVRNVEIPGRWVRVLFSIPTIIRLYNWYMGGTDSMDQFLSYYRPHLKAISWVPRMMCHFVNISVVNAFILFKEYYSKERYNLLQFIENLINQLPEEYIASCKEPTAITTTSTNHRWRTKASWEKSYLERTSMPPHYCIIAGRTDAYTRPGYQINYNRGKCILCRRDVQTKCQRCNVHLCIVEYEGSNCPTCFYHFHNAKVFPPMEPLNAKKQAHSNA